MLEKVLYFASYIVTDPGTVRELQPKQLLTEKEYRDLREKYEDDFEAGMGAEAIKKLLEQIDLDEERPHAQSRARQFHGPEARAHLKAPRSREAFRQSGNRPEWMILDVVPVIPPDLRPMVQLDAAASRRAT